MDFTIQVLSSGSWPFQQSCTFSLPQEVSYICLNPDDLFQEHIVKWSCCLAQLLECVIQEPEVPGSTPGPARYFCFSFRRFMKGSCQLLAKYVHEVLVNCIGGLSLPRKSVVRLTDRPDMTIDVNMDVKTTQLMKSLGPG